MGLAEGKADVDILGPIEGDVLRDIFRLIDGATLVLPNGKLDVNNTHRLT
jgi:hypothetical protein